MAFPPPLPLFHPNLLATWGLQKPPKCWYLLNSKSLKGPSLPSRAGLLQPEIESFLQHRHCLLLSSWWDCEQTMGNWQAW